MSRSQNGIDHADSSKPPHGVCAFLVDSRADSKGVTIQVYRPTGRPQYAS